MIRILLPLILIALPGVASAAERRLYIGGFDKVRVQGPFEVRIATGRPPGAVLSGDRRVIEAVEIRVDGSTLVVRQAIGRWEEQPRAAPGEPVVVTLATHDLSTASVIGAGRVAIAGMKAARIDLSVTGTGGIAVTGVAADAANATVIGGGSVTMAGRAGRVRLLTNGPGAIDAGALTADEVTIRLDGPGSTKANARYTATVANVGLGEVIVAGNAKCTVSASAGGPVSCGVQR